MRNLQSDVVAILNASDNLYDGFKSYNKIAKSGKVGKAWAEIIEKISNMNWLRRKLKKGFKIVDIGIDSKRIKRSSSCFFEKAFLNIWNSRNIWKLSCHKGD